MMSLESSKCCVVLYSGSSITVRNCYLLPKAVTQSTFISLHPLFCMATCVKYL